MIILIFQVVYLYTIILLKINGDDKVLIKNTQILSRNSSTGAIEFLTLSAVTTDTFVTGFTYDNQNKLTLSQNQGQPDLIVYINQFSGLSINGL